MKKHTEKTCAQQFLDVFKSLCHTRGSWQAWSDFIVMTACGISNTVDKAMFDEREQMYMRVIQGYTKDELDKIAQLFALTVMALEENPDQDFLGDIFNELRLYNEHKGQYFTPYNVAKAMALMLYGNLSEEINEKGSISVNDCCCGAGALLIAAANVALQEGVNYQHKMVFVAQDIDFTAAMMCYIALSLLGCVGYVIVGNSLTPDLPSRENIWYMPMNILHRKLLEEFYHSN